MSWIDLHTHSTYSDGALSPAELISLALQRGLSALALTDHDTVAGLSAFYQAAADKPLQVLGGIEISSWYNKDSLHILGYGLDHSDARLNLALTQLQQARHQRNLEILAKLNELGIAITHADLEYRENGQVGRPHIARALIRCGAAGDFQNAFHRYLRRGGAAYIESYRIHALDAIRLIAAAGGAPVLAHPAVADASLNSLPVLLPELRQAGLVGLEVYYPAHNHKQHQNLLKLAAEHRLIATGGTDFHEDPGNGVPLGGSCRTVRVPHSCFSELSIFLDRHSRPFPDPHQANLEPLQENPA